MDPLKRVLTREVKNLENAKKYEKFVKKRDKARCKMTWKMREKTMTNDKTWKRSHYLNCAAKVSRIDLQEGELYAQHYDQRKELGRSLNIL